jgi:hypothetical protein
MAKSEAKANKPGTIPSLDFDPLLQANKRSVEAVAEANSQVLENVAKFNNEILQFVNQRLEHDRKVAKELAACSSPQEAYGVCGQFLESAMKQYSEEMGIIAGLYTDHLRQTIENTQNQLKETVQSAAGRDKHDGG